ncbi:C-X-C chemokine receptor type 3-like [Gastrophryne carolinensis]
MHTSRDAGDAGGGGSVQYHSSRHCSSQCPRLTRGHRRIEDEENYENITFPPYSPYSDDTDDNSPCTQEKARIFDENFVPSFYTLLSISGILGNGLVMVVLLSNKQKIQSTNVFILHLAASDILLAITLPFWAVQATFGWIFGEIWCKIIASFFKVNFYAGTFLLTCISCDRYLSIVFAVQIYKKHRLHLVYWSCLIVWIFSFFLCIPDAIYYSATFDARTNTTECQAFFPLTLSKSWKAGMAFLYHIVGFLLPFAGMLFCYSHIVITLLRSQGFKKHKALRLIIAVVVAFFLCWTPYNIVALVDTINMLNDTKSTCGFNDQIDIALSITSGLCYFHSCLNPVLYAFIAVNFRSNLAELLSRWGLCSHFVARNIKRGQSSTKSFTWSESGDTSFSGIN